MRPTPISRRRGEKRNRRPHRGSTVSVSKPSKTAQPHTGPRVSAPCLRPDERVNSRARIPIRIRGNVARRTRGCKKLGAAARVSAARSRRADESASRPPVSSISTAYPQAPRNARPFADGARPARLHGRPYVPGRTTSKQTRPLEGRGWGGAPRCVCRPPARDAPRRVETADVEHQHGLPAHAWGMRAHSLTEPVPCV